MIGALFGLWASLAAAAAAPEFQEIPCADPALAAVARCGRVRVPEDRSDPDGRQIALNLVILSAIGERRLPPIYDLAGGPGLPATKTADFYLNFGAGYRQARDIVLIDQRGTGGSNPLYCADLASPERHYQPLYPADLVAACRRDLSRGARLEHYGTDEAAADLDAVRGALGHDRIDIVGLSYGTLLALRYDQLHPGRVRAMVLFGTVTPEARVLSGHAGAGERALFGLFAACAADPACAAAFPSPRADLDRALARLDDIAGAPERDLFLERLRSLMYLPSGARKVPAILRAAASGDLGPFFAATGRSEAAPYSDGVYLSIVCAEGVAGLDYPAVSAAARRTVFGDYRLRRQREACRGWPIRPVASDYFDPPTPAAATLFVSGSLDPVTPPDWAEAVARRSPRARHIILDGGGHVPEGLSAMDTCLDPLIIAFLDHGDPARIDDSCVSEVRPPPFQLAAAPERG